jgi:putative exosortase-associated protein (TIGR04073 family)
MRFGRTCALIVLVLFAAGLACSCCGGGSKAAKDEPATPPAQAEPEIKPDAAPKEEPKPVEKEHPELKVPAEKHEPPTESGAENTVGKIFGKFGRGIVNVVTGWIEFPKQIIETSEKDGVLTGVSLGLLKGIGMTVVRTGAGALDIAFFLSPFPDDYKPILDPEYVFE